LSLIWPATQVIQFWFHWRLMVGLLLAAAAFQAFVLIFRRSNSDHPGLIQVRISERGCVQYDRLSGMSVTNELLRGHGWLIPLIVALGLIVALRFGQVEPFVFWIWLPLAVLFAGALWPPCRRFRIALSAAREGSIADLTAVYRALAP
jgi:hypothetical protein